MRVNLTLPDDLFRRLQIASQLDGIAPSTVARLMVSQALDARGIRPSVGAVDPRQPQLPLSAGGTNSIPITNSDIPDNAAAADTCARSARAGERGGGSDR